MTLPLGAGRGCRRRTAPPGFGDSPGEGIALRPFTAAMTKAATRQRFLAIPTTSINFPDACTTRAGDRNRGRVAPEAQTGWARYRE